MKVIFLKDVRGVARAHDVKEVSEGYARNYLLPRGFAKLATKAGLNEVTRRIETAEHDHAEHEKRLSEIARTVSGKTLTFDLKTDAHGSLYGSVTKEMILRAMREHGWLGKERIEIEINHPLKKVGDYTIIVKLKTDLQVPLGIRVRQQR